MHITCKPYCMAKKIKICFNFVKHKKLQFPQDYWPLDNLALAHVRDVICGGYGDEMDQQAVRFTVMLVVRRLLTHQEFIVSFL